ncbi:MAG: hypothetical protein AAF514_01110 [Verrucomicrobiota bacterium]
MTVWIVDQVPAHLRKLGVKILREKLLERDRIDYHLGDFIIMPNRVHLLINPVSGIELEKSMQFIKGGSAFLLNKALSRKGALAEGVL